MDAFHPFLLQEFSEVTSPQMSTVPIPPDSFLKSSILTQKHMYQTKEISVFWSQVEYSNLVTTQEY